MRILITDWALDADAGMVGRDFTEKEYRGVLRPDIARLHRRDADPRFKDARFWGPAQSGPACNVPDGFKMKWHNIGPGLIQLRDWTTAVASSWRTASTTSTMALPS